MKMVMMMRMVMVVMSLMMMMMMSLMMMMMRIVQHISTRIVSIYLHDSSHHGCFMGLTPCRFVCVGAEGNKLINDDTD